MKIAVFWGSKSLKNDEKMSKIWQKLEKMLKKLNINEVIYGWWDSWVMWLILEKSKENLIPIKWIYVELEEVSNKIEDKIIFKTDDERIKYFFSEADAFLALPWWLWTIREILSINELIKRNKSSKQIYVLSEFDAYSDLMKKLSKEDMIADLDKNITKIV